MKNYSGPISFILLIAISLSCNKEKSYSDQFTDHKEFTSRISDLNNSIDKIKSTEKGKLIKEDTGFLKYTYKIGMNDSYEVSYLFDEKGCYEIGIDGDFKLESRAKDITEGIKLSMKKGGYASPKEDNDLYRWKNSSESISIELDNINTSKGIFLVTIFANE